MTTERGQPKPRAYRQYARDPANKKPGTRTVITRRPRGRSRAQLAALEQKRAQAYTLWLAGITLEVIAERLEYADASGAKKAIDAHRALQVAAIEGTAFHDAIVTLHKLRAALWTKAMAGDDRAVTNLLRLLEREAKLLGLDAPMRLAMGGDADAPAIRTVSAQLIVTSEVAADALKSLAEAGLLPDGLAQAWAYGGDEGSPDAADVLELPEQGHGSQNGPDGATGG